MSIGDSISFGTFDPNRIRQAAYSVISRGQDDPATQIIGTAIALQSMCKAANLNIGRLLENTDRRKDDLDGPFVSMFRAIDEYTRQEIGRG